MSDYQGNIVIKNPATPTGPTAYGRAPGMWKLSEVAYWIKQGVWPNPAIVPDLNFPYVSLLLSTTSLGNANNNLFVDSSGAFNPVSRFGNTTQGSFTPYSTNWSNYFDGTGDYLTLPYSTALQFTGDFTVEMWVFPVARVQTYPCIVNNYSTYTSNGGFAIFAGHGSANTSKYQVAFNGSFPVIQSTSDITYNSWSHIALVRSGSTLTLYVNGVANGTATSSATVTGTANNWWVGTAGDTTSGGEFNGYVSNLRAVKGTAVYTANFTPPTSALTAISGTSLLTCQANRFRDASTNNFTITVNGNTSVQDFSPFSPAYPGASYNQSDITNWSGYFDGTGDYLTTTNTNFTGDATVECWLYVNSLANSFQVFGTNNGSADGKWIGALVNTSGAILGAATAGSGGFYQSANGVIKTGQWQHIAWVKNGSNIFVYVNGSQVATCTVSAGYAYNATPLYISRLDGNDASCLNGYISNMRMVNGTAVYTGAFTPPTSPLTAISGTSLLTLQNAAFTDNSTNNFVITPFGNTTVTGNSPFNTTGYWSNYFDGSGDYLSIPSSPSLNFGTGNWTIECWVYVSTRTTNYPLIFGNNRGGWTTDALALTLSNADSASYNDKFVFAWNNGGFSSPSAGTSQLLVANVTNNKGTWYHFAAVRNGTSVKMYRDGVEVASATVSAAATFSWGFNGSLIGGGNWDGASGYMNGYVSNLRVTSSAVYTAAFTPPTSPLTAISGTVYLTCQNGRFIDNSTNAFTITRNGDTSIQPFNPFYTATIASNGGSMYFDGNADYVSIPNGPSMVLSGGTYTLEAWVYPTGDRSAYRTIFVKRAGDPTPCAWQVSLATSTGNLIFYNGTLYNSGVAVPLNAWSHVAAVYDGTNINLYLNGSRVLQSATSNVDCNANAQIGYFFSSIQEPFIGYIANARILKGVQAYTGTSYTVPTAPANPTAATVLMVNGMNAGIYDATTINDMETVGNAQVTTAVSKFGGSSIALDGTGDYLKAPNSDVFAFRTGDFTVEMWAYFADNAATNRPLFDTGVSSNTGRLLIRQGNDAGTSNVVNAFVSGTTISSPTISFNQWTHVAVVRQSGTVKIYINGTGGTGVSASADLTQNGCLVGAFYDQLAWNFTGYIDDLRVTRGVARYTSNFTPPTQAFPVY